ncbi:UTRA domain-containing protein [Amphiplicatus metriothermophilus]|uniref:Transcriptional regulator, GntR family n=1 Tax=Amphiplicatus metriothermophilus TaxID=1519374 RepID=A0A239PY42_9PROT|nr:UTRA domain-containing protein [Amphiplicatus metriothermophilus]MBB5519767.1 GntR family histidine utilization transcriptional repressor [Amphiplicatus metriothermophilus]SNT75229.1 transcriptional regulator, GntR family [Amphiplicatus metriothermophilus]
MTATPLYKKVKNHILARIENGDLPVDARAPSEAELVQTLGVSRMTANRALNELAKEGLLVRIAGSGTFVADRRARGELFALRDIAVELAERGHEHSADVLVQEKVAASREAAEAFDESPGAPLIRARVLHRRDGEPVLLEDRLVNAAVAPGYLDADLARTTSYQYLSSIALPEKVEHVVRAAAAPADIARRLAVPVGAPLLIVRRRTWSRGRVVSTATLHYAGDRYELSGVFGPDGAGRAPNRKR